MGPVVKYGKYIDIFCLKKVQKFSHFCSKKKKKKNEKKINVFENT